MFIFFFSAMAHYLRHVPRIMQGYPVPEIVDEAYKMLAGKSDQEIAYMAQSAQTMLDMTEGRSLVPSMLVGVLSLIFSSQLLTFPVKSLVQTLVLGVAISLLLLAIVSACTICLNSYFQVAILQAVARIRMDRNRGIQQIVQQRRSNKGSSFRKLVKSLFGRRW